MTAIPEDAQRLANRLRQLADEVESAARFKVPIPYCFTVSGHEFGGASFSASEDEFAEWAAYTDAETEDYEHAGAEWSKAAADVNGLPLTFAVKHTTAREGADVAEVVR